MPPATVFACWVYPNFCAWLQEASWLTSESALFVGYVILWFFFTISLNMLFAILVPERYHAGINFWNKLAGCLASGMGAGVLLLAATVVADHNGNFPEPPRLLWFPQMVAQGYRASTARQILDELSDKLPPKAVEKMVTKNAPEYQPTFTDQQASIEDLKRTMRFRQLFHQMREIETWDGE